jgi:hypothetical protein
MGPVPALYACDDAGQFCANSFNGYDFPACPPNAKVVGECWNPCGPPLPCCAYLPDGGTDGGSRDGQTDGPRDAASGVDGVSDADDAPADAPPDVATDSAGD